MIRRSLLLFAIVLCVCAMDVFSQEPAWILVERGRMAYEERELSDAMDFFLEAVEKEPEYPEAEYWLGRVFEAQGQPDLAEEQYRRAIDVSLYLRVPEDVILFRYSLAALLFAGDEVQRKEAQVILSSIVDEEAVTMKDEIATGHRYISLLTENGLDDLLFLYRDERSKSLRALRMLGENAWVEARYRTALLNSTKAVLSMLTTVTDSFRDTNPGWRFDIDPIEDSLNPDRDVRYPGRTDGIIDLIEQINDVDSDLAIWLEKEGFWPQLYLLSISLYANGFESVAEDIWKILVIMNPRTSLAEPRPEAGQWGRLALRQLESPFISIGALAP